MTAFIWVHGAVALAVHDEQISEHGGLEGVRDMGMFESAMARPQNMHAYDQCQDIAKLAAAYAYGIAKNHPFMDGNKRTALVTAVLFLELNGYELVASDSECVLTILALADGTMPEADLAVWIKANTQPGV